MKQLFVYRKSRYMSVCIREDGKLQERQFIIENISQRGKSFETPLEAIIIIYTLAAKRNKNILINGIYAETLYRN